MKTILVDAWNTFVTADWVNTEMQKLLDSFPNKKVILTNADSEKQVELWLVNVPYELFTLNFNPLKTDPKYYEIFLERYWLWIDEVTYFEHNLDAINSAKSLWINTYYYDKDKKDLVWLEKFLRNNLTLWEPD